MSVLQEAHDIIYGDREKTYGDPAKNLTVIANLWEMYLDGRGVTTDGEGLNPEDVAIMMMLLKIARLANDPTHHDSQVDICGYAALLERIQHGNKTRESVSQQRSQVPSDDTLSREDE